MPTLTSADGTTIAYERSGIGPPIVLVDGALCDRRGPMRPVAERLHGDFTVFRFDRRGRGESTDTLPYSVQREIEDLRSLVHAAGDDVSVYAMSSGGALAMATAAVEPRIGRIVLYEPPFMAAVGDDAPIKAYTEELSALLGAGRRGDAVALFMTHVGIPEPVVTGMRSGPGWPAFEAIAPTLAYDDALLNGGRVPHGVATKVTVPALVLSGGDSPVPLQQAAKATAHALPAAEFRLLDGQTHDVDPDVLTPVLAEFFTG